MGSSLKFKLRGKLSWNWTKIITFYPNEFIHACMHKLIMTIWTLPLQIKYCHGVYRFDSHYIYTVYTNILLEWTWLYQHFEEFLLKLVISTFWKSSWWNWPILNLFIQQFSVLKHNFDKFLGFCSDVLSVN